MENKAVIIIIDENSNPLKGALSYYNFFLNGEISRLMYENEISLNSNNKVILYKNEETELIPEKIVFLVNFDDKLDIAIKHVIKSLRINQPFIIK